jgi:hypothetical protein
MFGPGDGWLLLQLSVLCFGLLIDGDVRVGIFQEREEILVRSLGFAVSSSKAYERASCRRVSEFRAA